MTDPERRAQAVVEVWLRQNEIDPGSIHMTPEAVECILAFRDFEKTLTKPRRFARFRAFIARLKVNP